MKAPSYYARVGRQEANSASEADQGRSRGRRWTRGAATAPHRRKTLEKRWRADQNVPKGTCLTRPNQTGSRKDGKARRAKEGTRPDLRGSRTRPQDPLLNEETVSYLCVLSHVCCLCIYVHMYKVAERGDPEEPPRSGRAGTPAPQRPPGFKGRPDPELSPAPPKDEKTKTERNGAGGTGLGGGGPGPLENQNR